jgi:hypothetical protein
MKTPFPKIRINPIRQAASIPGYQAGKVFSFPLNNASPDGYQIVAVINQLVRKFSHNVYVRQSTVALFPDTINNNAIEEHFRIVVRFVRDQMRYVRDPTGSEFIISPVNLLREISRKGFGLGDCDDQVLLLNSMLGSIGFKTKVVGTVINGADHYNHVISSVWIDKQWVDIDPCIASGIQPEYQYRLE